MTTLSQPTGDLVPHPSTAAHIARTRKKGALVSEDEDGRLSVVPGSLNCAVLLVDKADLPKATAKALRDLSLAHYRVEGAELDDPRGQYWIRDRRGRPRPSAPVRSADGLALGRIAQSDAPLLWSGSPDHDLWGGEAVTLAALAFLATQPWDGIGREAEIDALIAPVETEAESPSTTEADESETSEPETEPKREESLSKTTGHRSASEAQETPVEDTGRSERRNRASRASRTPSSDASGDGRSRASEDFRVSDDWLPKVVECRYGKPTHRAADGSQRWRKRQSFSVFRGQHGWTWHDFGTGESGKVLKFVMRELKCGAANAVKWLRAQGFGDSVPRASSELAPKRTPPSKTAALAGRVLAASEPADDSPGRLYLERRLAWPPLPDRTLPRDVRWLSAARFPAGLAFVPPCAGLIAFAYRHAGKTTGCEVEAIAVNGQRVDKDGERWKRTFGSVAGSSFEARAGDGSRHAAEGAVDALAVSWLAPGGQCIATGGSGGLSRLRPDGRPLTVWRDRDQAGRRSYERVRAAFAESPDALRCATPPRGCKDPAEGLAMRLRELAAVGKDAPTADWPKEALADAWSSVMDDIERRRA